MRPSSEPDPGPSQSDVLRERFSQVPWRRALRDVLSDRLGRGPTAIPDRIEGAVYGQLVAEARTIAGSHHDVASATGTRSTWSSAHRAPLIEGVSWAVESRRLGTDAAVAGMLAALQATGTTTPRPEVADDGIASAAPPAIEPAVAMLHALLVRRLISGERDRARILKAALADLARVGLDPAVARDDPTVRLAWAAFAGADGIRHALERGPDRISAALMAGGLAGAYWGGAAIPSTWRRSIADPTDARTRADRLIEAEPTGADDRRWVTSTSSPLVVDAVRIDANAVSIDASGLSGGGLEGEQERQPAPQARAMGQLGISALPGRRYVAYHTGAHWRDLDTDCARLRALGYETLLLLVEDRELERCRVTGIGGALEAAGIELIRHPIRDPLVPRDGPAFHRTIGSVLERLRAGRSVAVACRGGLDRSGMAAACVLREAGSDAARAIAEVQAARHRALRLPDQQAYVRAWPPTGSR